MSAQPMQAGFKLEPLSLDIPSGERIDSDASKEKKEQQTAQIR